MSISVVILAKNEEHLLDECLSQFYDFADEIIYGDMESTDNSIEIAKRYTNKIYTFEQTNYLDSTKSKLCEYASGDWILVVDADEIFPEILKNKLKDIANNDEADVVGIPRQIYIFREKLIGMGWQNDLVERFFKKGYLEYSDYHHTMPEKKGRLLNLKRDRNINMIHYWVDDWSTLIRKLTYYSQGQAEKLDKEGIKYSNILMIWKVIRQFLSRYIRSYGFLNGWLGIKISFMMCIDVFFTYMKLEELQRKKKK